MKVLYAIQGTGNGHVSRAREVIPHLLKMCDLDILLSGNNSNIPLPVCPKYHRKGLSFEYNDRGGLSYYKTFKKANFTKLIQEIKDFPIKQYDLIINDFDCVSSYAARLRRVPVMAFSHQVALLSKYCPKPKGLNLMGKSVIKNYAPTDYAVGLHFKQYDDFIHTPIIRKEIRALDVTFENHYTVYLPAVSDENLISVLSKIKDVHWEIFSVKAKDKRNIENITIHPVNNTRFLKSLASCTGLLTSAGFEAPAEAMFLKKKLFIIPISGQYEQQCNAEAMIELGVKSKNKFDFGIINDLKSWVNNNQDIKIHFPNITEQLIEKMLFEQEPFLAPTLAMS